MQIARLNQVGFQGLNKIPAFEPIAGMEAVPKEDPVTVFPEDPSGSMKLPNLRRLRAKSCGERSKCPVSERDKRGTETEDGDSESRPAGSRLTFQATQCWKCGGDKTRIERSI
jgi:hypothetical protein